MENSSQSPIKPMKSPYVFGIDLGTSNSAIAAYVNHEAHILPIDGDKSCPSVVSVRDDGEILVGRAARNRLMIDPDNTVASVKREIGSAWTKEFAGLPGKIYTPVDISAEILQKLINTAPLESPLPLRGTPGRVVICIPANFNDTQKTATLEAAALANLEALELLEEPVAAAIGYGDASSRDQTILVYDLGGGTFDVSILTVDSKQGGRAAFAVKAKDGVPRLGGDDFDRRIMELAAANFKESSGLDILDLRKDQGISAKSLREAQQKLRDACEHAKRELTETQTAAISLPNLLKDESGALHHLEMELTREQFNEAVRDLILQSREAVERALASAKMTFEDIDRIIMVGGTTKVPLVKEVLTEMFNKEPWQDVDPDTIVARGAAIYGASLNVVSEPGATRPEILVSNIVTHYLGIETVGGKFSCLIQKDREIPEQGSVTEFKEYTTPRDNMTELVIRVYQADRPTELIGSEGITYQGEFFLKGIPPRPRGEETITVTFEIDHQNLLRVRANSSSSSDELEIQRA